MTVPARRPEDDHGEGTTLDNPVLYQSATELRGLTELEASVALLAQVEQLREERDEALRKLANEKALLREADDHYEAAEAEADKYRKATDQQARRAEAAEAEVRRLDELRALYLSEADRWSEEARRLTEGLRERDEIIDCLLQRGYFDPFVPLAAFRKIVPKGAYSVTTADEERAWLAKIEARALLADSPDGEPLCPCGHPASQHPAIWTMAGDATTACQEEGCRCLDYDGPPDGGGAITGNIVERVNRAARVFDRESDGGGAK